MQQFNLYLIYMVGHWFSCLGFFFYRHETEVSNLTDRLNNLEERLETERELHERCKKGLGQLMLHYSQSTQVQGIIDAGGNDKNCAKI